MPATTEHPHASRIADALHGFGGDILRGGDALFDDARRLFNDMIDRKPAIIARCRSVADVQKAVRAARATGVPLSVRGGGHNVAGNAICDDGLVIDLSGMRSMTVDPIARIARAGGGATWGAYDAATQAHGLASTGGVVSTTGVGGLTLGGGIGWLQRKYGLASDNLIGVEMVTAEGEVVRASAKENPDLFWAVRGGGGNFGVVTTLEYQLFPVGPMVYGGLVGHPLPRAAEVFRFYQAFTSGLPDEATVFAALLTSPAGPVIGLAAAHCGDPSEGERVLSPLKEFGPPVMDALGPLPYVGLQRMLDEQNAPGMRHYWKSTFIKEANDAVFATAVEAFKKSPSPRSSIVFEQLGGAVARAPAGDTAVNFRKAPFNMLIISMWDNAADDAANRDWARATFAAMAPHAADIAYVNYLGTEGEEGAERLRASYGPEKLARLAAIKAKYDPGNLFRFNQNIRPAA